MFSGAGAPGYTPRAHSRVAEDGTLSAPPALHPGPRAFPLLALAALSPLVPPEVHGTSAAAAALLALSAAAIGLRSAPGPRGLPLVVAAALAVPLARFAEAPGAAVAPLAAAGLAWGLVLAAGDPEGREGLRSGLLRVLVATGGIVGARAVWERLFGLRRMAERVREAEALPAREAILDRLEQGRAYAGFVTPAAAGAFLALALAVTVGVALAASGRRRIALLVLAALEAAGLAATQSLTAGAALFAALALAAAIAGSRRTRGVLAAGLAIGGIVLATGIAARGSAVLGLDHPDSPWRLRAGNWRIAAEIARDAPWLGVGPGGYAEAFPRHREDGDNESRHAHGLPAELLAELGIPLGLAASLAFFVFFFRRFRSDLREGDPVRAGVAIGAAAFALHNLADFTAWLPSVLWPALLARAAWGRAEERSPGGASRFAAIAAVAIAGAIVALGGLSGDARARAVEEAHLALPEDALRSAERAASLAPWDPEAALVLASARFERAAALGAAEETRRSALEVAERAVALAPTRAAARAARARARLLVGDLPGAFADYDRAAALHPLREEYRRDRAILADRLPGAGP